MICGIFHEGSGLGDQLMRYITVRTLAESKGYDWYLNGEFKGKDFMPLLQVGGNKKEGLPYSLKQWNEKSTTENGLDIRSYDPEINFVEDNTVIDGSFEDDKYWRHNLKSINEWLSVEPLAVPDDVCVIGFRGGEYTAFPELFLPKTYWDTAIAEKRAIEPNMRFEVHTDDPETARIFFPDFPIIENTRQSHSKHSNMGYNWRAMRYAKHTIIANSSFFIIPRILAHQDKESHTIAPRYWARHNTQTWARPACYYPEFKYIV